MRIRVLGPAQICAGEHRVDVGPPQRCLVFAALAADVGRPVPREKLIERVWGQSSPPSGAWRVVQTHVASIRGLLRGIGGPDAGEVLRSRGGYVLDLDADQVDVHRFRRLVAQAANNGHTAGDRVALWRRAIGLWQGDPLAGLTGEWATRTRDSWYGEYRDAVLGWASAEIQVENPAAVIGPLTELIHRYPLVEPLPAMLMRALYAAGRRVDALTCYHSARERLEQELAERPGTELQLVYQSILRQEPEVSRPSGGSPLTPAQLPADVRGFAGRTEQLGSLDAIAATTGQGVTIVAIAGTAGVGKTALAVHWAHRASTRFPDGQLYVNLRGFDPGGEAMDPAHAVRGFLDALAVPPERIPASRDAQAALYRTELAGKRMLVVLDNARDSAQVRPLLPGAPGCLVLVTSRDRLASIVAATGAYPLPLDLPDQAEARDLLAHRLGTRRVSAEPEAVDSVIAGCARLPLALAIVAARAATTPHLPIATVAAELSDSRTRLNALADPDPAGDVSAVFSWSHSTLTPAAARLFRLLGLNPGPDLPTAVAVSLAGAPLPEVRAQLAELVHAHLVVEHQPDRYACHDLLRAYAAELARRIDTPAERDAAIVRLLDHYLHTGDAASKLLNPTRDQLTLDAVAPGASPEPITDLDQALDWFAAERPALMAAVHLALAAGRDTHTWQLAWILQEFLDRRAHRHDEVAIWRVAVAAAERSGDPALRARAGRILARGLIALGQHDEADRLLGEALVQAEHAGESIGRAHTHHIRATLRSRMGRYADALDDARQAGDLYVSTGHRAGLANALNSIGWYHTQLGDHQQALAVCHDALAEFGELGDVSGEAAVWDTLGLVHHQLGDLAEARACYQQALDRYEQLGDPSDEADTLVSLGHVHQTAGDPGSAEAVWRRALAILDELGHPDADTIRAKLSQGAGFSQIDTC